MKNYIYYFLLFLVCCNPLFAQEINVRDFGAKGDGKTDDTEALNKAMSYGAQIGNKVVFPEGIYLISQLSIKANVEGRGNAVIKRSISGKHGHYDFCTITRHSGLSIINLTFDANSSQINSRKGSNKGIPLFIYSSKNIKIENCKFLNASMSGLRIESSSDIFVNNSNSVNSSGNFGDGFYIAKSANILIRNSTATKYTRIGFVVENYSSEITFENCAASIGTNASILHGGREYNAGFWYENCTNVYTKSCRSDKNTHLGFVAASTKKGSKPAFFSFDNCVSRDNPIGFNVASKGNIPVNVTVTNCKAINVDRGFVATARHLRDKFEFENCAAYMKKISENSLNSVGFMWESPVSKDSKKYSELPTFIYSQSKVVYDRNERMSRLTNSKSNNGDISTYTGGNAKIVIQGVTNSLTGSELILKSRRGKPVYLKR